MKLLKLLESVAFVLFFIKLKIVLCDKDENQGPVIPPTKCEVCKYLANELKERLQETGKSRDVLETGYGIEKKKKRTPYFTSELRMIEAMENPHVCDKILQYNVHKERKGSLRFAKGQSETFDTLHKLVNKGVKVDLGIPYELWDTPSAEVTQLQRECYMMVEDYEDIVWKWYYKHQSHDIVDYLCRDHVLIHDDQKCLDEVYVPKGETNDGNVQDKSKEKRVKKKTNGKQKGEEANKDEL